ncbi:MAG: hypothetical protein GX952_00760 [Firmicutes bacterium]|nr:hypothetical protein [Bacillota bacterium]
MTNRTARQVLADDIKREVIMDLTQTRMPPAGRQNLIDNIKQEILLDLNNHQFGFGQCLNRALVEAVKDEVLAQIRAETRSVIPDRATVEALKREIIAQLEAEREEKEQAGEREQGIKSEHYYGFSEPALVQAVKNSVLAELNRPLT